MLVKEAIAVTARCLFETKVLLKSTVTDLQWQNHAKVTSNKEQYILSTNGI